MIPTIFLISLIVFAVSLILAYANMLIVMKQINSDDMESTFKFAFARHMIIGLILSLSFLSMAISGIVWIVMYLKGV